MSHGQRSELSVSHCRRESLWRVIKALEAKLTRTGDSFMNEFVCHLVSNAFRSKYGMSDDARGQGGVFCKLGARDVF